MTNVCNNCGEELKPLGPYVEPHPLDRQRGHYGLVRTAITFTLNQTKGCAHNEEVQALYEDYFNTVAGFTNAILGG